jgi:hypothetical protein
MTTDFIDDPLFCGEGDLSGDGASLTDKELSEARYEFGKRFLALSLRPSPLYKKITPQDVTPEILEAVLPSVTSASLTAEQRARRYGLHEPCIGNDPTCPCQDGDCCHYGGPDAWPVPSKP